MNKHGSSHDFAKEFSDLKEKYQRLERQKIEVEIKKQSVLDELKKIEDKCEELGFAPSDLPKRIEQLEKQLKETVAELKKKFEQFNTSDTQVIYTSASEDIPF